MKHSVWFWVVVFCMWALPIGRADASPMVKRHLFTPESETNKFLKGLQKSPLVEKLKKELIFSGIIKSSQGNWAMIRDRKARGRKGQQEAIKRYEEGDEIRGLLIKEIGSNYLVLTGEGSEVRLNLFQGEKRRPAAPPALPSTTAGAAARQSKSAPAAGGSTHRLQKSAADSSQKAAQLSKSAKNKAQGSSVVSPTVKSSSAKTSNPFAEALKRAREKRQAGGNQAPDENNPFSQALRRARGY